jgi:hypothetical protein
VPDRDGALPLVFEQAQEKAGADGLKDPGPGATVDMIQRHGLRFQDEEGKHVDGLQSFTDWNAALGDAHLNSTCLTT